MHNSSRATTCCEYRYNRLFKKQGHLLHTLLYISYVSLWILKIEFTLARIIIIRNEKLTIHVICYYKVVVVYQVALLFIRQPSRGRLMLISTCFARWNSTENSSNHLQLKWVARASIVRIKTWETVNLNVIFYIYHRLTTWSIDLWIDWFQLGRSQFFLQNFTV